MEDLGDLHLDNALGGVSQDEELAFYRDGMEILFRFQTIVTEQMFGTDLLGNRVFDEDSLLGETDYFASEFAGRYAGITLPAGWDRERRLIASALAGEQQVFMHRDFQSRNLLVKDGRIRVVDFQTAHRGPGLYDAASLLKDPYHALSHGTRKTLLMEFYYRLTEVGRESGSSFENYTERFVLAGIQRNLQALAAYAYLGSVRGKKEFLDSIEPALELLEEGLSETGEFPSIESSVRSIREKLAERK
jgi:aminoglycoside/choline kinase family phosphotransferase